MKEFKGTPGPWFWQDDGSGYSWLGPVGCGPLEAVHHDGSAWGEYSADIDVEGFDAKLIAAAPELLSALQNIVNYHFGKTATAPAYLEAKAAITKALGESQ